MRGVLAVDGKPVLSDVAIPVPSAREVVIRVQAAGVNRLDLLQVKGNAPPPGVTAVLGVECVGTIVSRHADCQIDDLQEGTHVMALCSGGAYSEFVVTDERNVFLISKFAASLHAFSFAQLASVPEAFMTAYQLLFMVAEVESGQTVVVHAAASSVGQAMIQMCLRKGVTVFGTSRSIEKCALCRSLGATECFLVNSDGKFAAAVQSANSNSPVDHVFCCIGPQYYSENIAMLRMDGTYSLYACMGGALATSDHSNTEWMPKLMSKRITLKTSTLRTRSIEYKAKLSESLANDTVCGLASTIPFQVRTHSVYPLEQVEQAHEEMKLNANAGKIVLTVSQVASNIEFLKRELAGIQERYV